MRGRTFPAPTLADLGLGLALAAWWVLEVGDLPGIAVASLGLCTAPLGWRRTAPFAALLLVAAGLVLSGAEEQPAEPLAQLVAVLVAAYSAAAHAGTQRAAAIAGAVVLAAGVATGLLVGDDVLFITVIVGGGWLAGFAIRRLKGRSAELEERAAQLDERARTAAADERARIARELHDVVSHSVSLMVVQAGAAEQVMREDPEQALRALRALQSTGRAAVDDLRRMLGLLRGAEEHGHTRAPQPGLAALDDLVDGFRGSGVAVDLDRPEHLPVLPPGADLAAFRIVQEGLTNAAKHAPRCPVSVRLQADGASLELEVRSSGAANGTPSGRGGHGLVGMRERAGLYGGSVAAGPEGRDWVVRASLPVPAP